MSEDVKDLLERAVGWYEPADRGPEGPRRRAERHRGRQRVTAAVVAFALFAAAGAFTWGAFRHTRAGTSPGQQSSQPTVAATIRVDGWPIDFTTAGASLWVIRGDDGALLRIDAHTDQPVGNPILCSMGAVATGADVLWAYGNNSNACLPEPTDGYRLWRIDPASGQVVGEIPVFSNPLFYMPKLAVGEGAVWVATWTERGTGDNFPGAPGFLWRIDPAGNRVTGHVRLGLDAGGLAVGEGAVWVTNASDRRPGTLFRIDPRTMRIVARITVGQGSSDVTVGFGSIWVANSDDGTVMRIDPKTNRVVATIPVEGGVSSLTAGEGAVWTSAWDSGTVARIDPSANRVTARLQLARPRLGLGPLEVGFGSVWVGSTDGKTIWRIDPHPTTGPAPSTRLSASP
jgi:YVTN family beta-propeller protein